VLTSPQCEELILGKYVKHMRRSVHVREREAGQSSLGRAMLFLEASSPQVGQAV